MPTTSASDPKRGEMRNRYRERVCDPIGQLLRYMTANGIRVGDLCCATRNYFVLIFLYYGESSTISAQIYIHISRHCIYV
jgi:hypothetical protein